jgi:hypothetical protein
MRRLDDPSIGVDRDAQLDARLIHVFLDNARYHHAKLVRYGSRARAAGSSYFILCISNRSIGFKCRQSGGQFADDTLDIRISVTVIPHALKGYQVLTVALTQPPRLRKFLPAAAFNSGWNIPGAAWDHERVDSTPRVTGQITASPGFSWSLFFGLDLRKATIHDATRYH